MVYAQSQLNLNKTGDVIFFQKQMSVEVQLRKKR